ncbi:hypothetical protein PEX1_100770 [Penicillium expansum]|uniref:Uncharacterized protein n=1 Tax=Penicillium expansum TaxID=27334 RepID=A0A0A2IPC0_PENEN|nr:hypothetical protein PEX2_065850 [Penicillium expansum]KGO44346.1 hypothetical protein PEXP_000370 [Penicillium expansum]KGO58601.1 hypothetical protein PEX2_065850 [Penicillium expansum]KGO58801.1 hypothetical protein PEX1_100770 [Penicillium expansum]
MAILYDFMPLLQAPNLAIPIAIVLIMQIKKIGCHWVNKNASHLPEGQYELNR